jgi:molecular chaperone GrpE
LILYPKGNISNVVNKLELLFDKTETLVQEVTKLGKQQFKAISITEHTQKQSDTAMEMLKIELEKKNLEIEDLKAQIENGKEGIKNEMAFIILEKILPIMDGLEACLKLGEELGHGSNEGNRNWIAIISEVLSLKIVKQLEAVESWLEGIQLLHSKLEGILKEYHIEPIKALGETFNPKIHTAVDIVLNSESPENTIVKEELKGYTFNSRVIRFSEVVVAKNK